MLDWQSGWQQCKLFSQMLNTASPSYHCKSSQGFYKLPRAPPPTTNVAPWLRDPVAVCCKHAKATSRFSIIQHVLEPGSQCVLASQAPVAKRPRFEFYLARRCSLCCRKRRHKHMSAAACAYHGYRGTHCRTAYSGHFNKLDSVGWKLKAVGT